MQTQQKPGTEFRFLHPARAMSQILIYPLLAVAIVACGGGGGTTSTTTPSTALPTTTVPGTVTTTVPGTVTTTAPSTVTTTAPGTVTTTAPGTVTTTAPSTGLATTTTTSTSTNADTICAQAANFPDVSLRTNYIDYNLDGKTSWDTTPALKPSVSVSCAAGLVSVVSNGVPNFDAVGTGRGGTTVAYTVNQVTWKFPTSPIRANTVTSLTNVLGPIAVMVNGVQIYGPVESPADNFADPYKAGLINFCGGHVSMYHFHAFPECFFNQSTLGTTAPFLPAKKPDVVVGYALDGFPIKAPYVSCTTASADCINGVKEISSAYKYTGTGAYTTEPAFSNNAYQAGYNGSPLDACNGMTDSNGKYAYYATRTFPYYLACYVGTKTAQ